MSLKTYRNYIFQCVFDRNLIQMKTIENKSFDIVCEINSKPYNKQSIRFHNKYGFKEVGRKDINVKKSVIYMIYEN